MPLRWWERGLVFGLALAVRLYGIAKAPLWSDEIFSWFVAHFSPGRIVSYLLEGNNPPLWELLLHGWMRLWGESVAAMRSLAALCSAGAAVGLYELGYRTGGRWAGASAAIAWIFSSFGQSVGREARAYALLACLTTLSHIAFLHWITARRGLLLWVLSLALLFYTHYMGVWVGLLQLAYLLWAWPAAFWQSAFWAAFVGLAVGALGPVVVFVERLWSYPTLQAGTYASLEGAYNLLWAFSNQPVPTIAALIVLGVGMALRLRSLSQPMTVSYPYWAFWGLFGFLWVVGHFAAIWQPRYLMSAAMGYYWVLGLSLAAWPKRIRPFAAGGLLLLWIGSWEATPSGPAADYPRILQRLSQKPSNQLLILSPPWHTLTWSYYLLHPIQEPCDLKCLDKQMYYQHRVIGAAYYADLPPCHVEAVDTLWWLDMGYCEAFPHGVLPEVLAHRFLPIQVEPLGKKAFLWLWVATEPPALDTRSPLPADSSCAESHSKKEPLQTLPQRSTR